MVFCDMPPKINAYRATAIGNRLFHDTMYFNFMGYFMKCPQIQCI